MSRMTIPLVLLEYVPGPAAYKKSPIGSMANDVKAGVGLPGDVENLPTYFSEIASISITPPSAVAAYARVRSEVGTIGTAELRNVPKGRSIFAINCCVIESKTATTSGRTAANPNFPFGRIFMVLLET